MPAFPGLAAFAGQAYSKPAPQAQPTGQLPPAAALATSTASWHASTLAASSSASTDRRRWLRHLMTSCPASLIANPLRRARNQLWPGGMTRTATVPVKTVSYQTSYASDDAGRGTTKAFQRGALKTTHFRRLPRYGCQESGTGWQSRIKMAGNTNSKMTGNTNSKMAGNTKQRPGELQLGKRRCEYHFRHVS